MSEVQSEVQLGDYNRAGYLAFMFCMAITLVFFVYIAFIHPGVDLKELEVEKGAAVGTSQDASPGETPKAE